MQGIGKSHRKSHRKSHKKSPKSRVNPFKHRRSTTAKSSKNFGVIMPLLTKRRERVQTKHLMYVNNFIRSGGQIKGMRRVEPADMDRVIRDILRDNGEIPLSHRLPSHRYSTVKKF